MTFTKTEGASNYVHFWTYVELQKRAAILSDAPRQRITVSLVHVDHSDLLDAKFSSFTSTSVRKSLENCLMWPNARVFSRVCAEVLLKNSLQEKMRKTSNMFDVVCAAYLLMCTAGGRAQLELAMSATSIDVRD